MATPPAPELILRIAHATDIHWMAPPPLRSLLGKRLLGSANLYLRGRRHHFGPASQDTLVRHLVDQQPDLVVISGDLTAQALASEFEAAHQALQPVLSALPTFVVPGNHDLYTRGARKAARIRQLFGPWMHLDSPPLGRLDLPELTVLGLDPCRPTAGPSAAGILPEDQLHALSSALHQADRPVLLVCHYPLVTREGQPYTRRSHGLLNAEAVLEVLRSAPTTPVAWLCGHAHRAYEARVDLSDGRSFPLHDAGAGGQLPHGERTATTRTYVVEEGQVVEVERYRLQDGGFVRV